VPLIHVRCRGTTGLDHIRIIRDGAVVKTVPCHGRPECEVEWVDEDYDFSRNACYYVRVVQQDHESAWSSPIWIG
jgi:hypothetical protein